MSERARSLAEVRCLEANAVASGVSIAQLMAHAGEAAAEQAKLHLPPPPAAVAVICGLGNNGGDGLAAARVLASLGYRPSVWILGSRSSVHTREARACLDQLPTGLPVREGPPSPEELKPFPLVIDAMLGTGGKGELREPYRTAVRAVSASEVPVLSIDLPTGLGTSEPLQAKWTVALEVLKSGMEAPACGEVVVRPLGMPVLAHQETGPGEFAFFPIPSAETRKSDSGRVVVVGGGRYAGAPYLAAHAAMRAGADMVFAVVPGGVADLVQGYSPEIIVRGVGDGRVFDPRFGQALIHLVESLRPTAILVGNGAGPDPQGAESMRALLAWALPRLPVAIDADGLRAISDGLPSSLGADPQRTLLTPNLREAVHLVGPPSSSAPAMFTLEKVHEWASRWRATVLVKGPVDVISDGVEERVNRTHHPAMVVGGAGDVLAGVASSLLARGVSAFWAARLATYWLGRAAGELFETQSYSITPLDLARQLAPTLRRGLSALGPSA